MPSTPSWELRVASVSLLGPWALCLPLHLSQEAGLGQVGATARLSSGLAQVLLP